MNDQGQARCGRSGNAYLNGVLTVIAGLLVMMVAQPTVGLPGPDAASAQRSSVRPEIEPRESMGMPNAADQRNRMIAALDRLDARMGRIETKLMAPLDVRVLEMPEVKKPE